MALLYGYFEFKINCYNLFFQTWIATLQQTFMLPIGNYMVVKDAFLLPNLHFLLLDIFVHFLMTFAKC